MDPVTGQLIGMGVGTLGSVLKAPPSAPSRSDNNSGLGVSPSIGSGFDGSGWTVSTGSSQAKGAVQAAATSPLLYLALVVGAVWLMHRG